MKMHARLMRCQVVKKTIWIDDALCGVMIRWIRAPTLQQIEMFNEVTQAYQGPRSLANSAGIIAWPSAHADWVRPGIMLYGASPFVGHRGVEHHLQPVMSLSSQLIAVHQASKGARVGYGGVWTCPEDMRIGVVGIGYGDGYPRHAANGTPVLVNGLPCPLAGRVAMDMMTVDLRTQPDAKVGDSVLLWGPGLPVEVVAEYSDTIGYELLTRITQRVRVEVKKLKSVHLSFPRRRESIESHLKNAGWVVTYGEWGGLAGSSFQNETAFPGDRIAHPCAQRF